MLLTNFRRIMQATLTYTPNELPGPNGANSKVWYNTATTTSGTYNSTSQYYVSDAYGTYTIEGSTGGVTPMTTHNGARVFQIALSTESGAGNVNDTTLNSYVHVPVLANTSRELDYGRYLITTTTFQLGEQSTPVEIKQMGLILYAKSSNSAYNTVLVAKSDLEESVTIQPGETKSFTYTIDFAQFVDNAVQNT